MQIAKSGFKALKRFKYGFCAHNSFSSFVTGRPNYPPHLYCKAPRIKSNIPVGEPAVIEIFVKAFFRQKLLMGALFNDGAMVRHENQAGAPDDRKPVDDNKFEPYRGIGMRHHHK